MSPNKKWGLVPVHNLNPTSYLRSPPNSLCGPLRLCVLCTANVEFLVGRREFYHAAVLSCVSPWFDCWHLKRSAAFVPNWTGCHWLCQCSSSTQEDTGKASGTPIAPNTVALRLVAAEGCAAFLLLYYHLPTPLWQKSAKRKGHRGAEGRRGGVAIVVGFLMVILDCLHWFNCRHARNDRGD